MKINELKKHSRNYFQKEMEAQKMSLNELASALVVAIEKLEGTNKQR